MIMHLHIYIFNDTIWAIRLFSVVSILNILQNKDNAFILTRSSMLCVLRDDKSRVLY